MKTINSIEIRSYITFDFAKGKLKINIVDNKCKKEGNGNE